ncbi:hypothetical protein L873DRAFT_1890071 [Choiromyces venosus 120613-1]|uniref:Uncharacterized protein n=1 Tax=Choiromyces venosus 120613-1 TaxID=1336337 RepID=A0A3N4JWR9_9PEZI|nr:hypothetical protein L873DRAFT_1890071 [Choiromyces venosus 120613-1]
MKATLQRDGVWHIVAQEEVKPAPTTDDHDDTTRCAIEHYIKDYCTRYDQATSTIHLDISEDLLLEHMSIYDLTVLWETIWDHYKSLEKEQGRNISSQLARISLKESSMVIAYFLQIESLCADLTVIQWMPVSEEERITGAMQGVPNECN